MDSERTCPQCGELFQGPRPTTCDEGASELCPACEERYYLNMTTGMTHDERGWLG